MSEEQINGVETEAKVDVETKTEDNVVVDIKEEVLSAKELKKKEKKEKKEEKKKNKEVVKLEKELEELQTFKEKYYYVAAEMENIKKRNVRDRENLLKYGNEKVLSALVDVMDNLERTQDAIKDDEDEKVKSVRDGIEMVIGQFVGVLKDSGLVQIESLGKEFDPNFHEAMAQQPAEGKKDQEVIQEYQKGYILNGRLLRAAKVIVAKN